MSGAAIREKLYDYIRVADEKKLKAIYSLLEDEINETADWWKDAAVVKELDKRYDNWLNEKEKAYTLEETAAYLKTLKKSKAK
ncbi:MAG: hypothetical protein GXC73_13760 [Chitinophagaceae bacterium]|nr:hypothetical protein [Chitinophagaceae bacterium]